MKKIYLSLIGLVIYGAGHTQNATITGRITEQGKNEPLKGVTISTQGQNPVLSDDNGKFSLPCTDSAQITLTQAGFETLTRKIRCGESLDISMMPAGKNLDEIEITA